MSKSFREIKNDFRGCGIKISNRGVRKYLHICERQIKMIHRFEMKYGLREMTDAQSKNAVHQKDMMGIVFTSERVRNERK